MSNFQPNTIVFITGAFVSSNCWDQWKKFFESKGYTVYVPAWPYKNAAARVLRNRHPNERLASMRLARLTDYFENIITLLPEEPILIGHSIGGLVTQILLNRGIGAAGIAIHSAAPKGLTSFKFSFLRASWGPLGFFTSTKKSFLMSFKQWQYAFCNGMTREQQRNAYDDFATPESKQLMRDCLSNAAKIDFAKPHEPLLFLAGSSDHFIPASLNYSNYRKYKYSNSITRYKEFQGRNHFVLGQPTWKQDATYILNWINNLRSMKLDQILIGNL